MSKGIGDGLTLGDSPARPSSQDDLDLSLVSIENLGQTCFNPIFQPSRWSSCELFRLRIALGSIPLSGQ